MTQNRAFYNLPVLSPQTAGEHRFLARLLRQCVLKLIREGKRTRANQLLALRDGLIADFKDRLLPLDVAVALMLGRLAEAARPKVIERVDLIIAATAKVHGLTGLSRSIRHFEPTDAGKSRVDKFCSENLEDVQQFNFADLRKSIPEEEKSPLAQETEELLDDDLRNGPFFDALCTFEEARSRRPSKPLRADGVKHRID
jgi:predicted nucleic acid-binding protein